MEELNKKLAEWAGIKWKITERTYNHLEQDIWVCPDGTIKDEPPDFTSSLDACFKWLVPRLGYVSIQHSDQYEGAIDAYYAVASIQFGDNHSWSDEDPALALCKAIEKLIDEEAK